MLIGITGSFGAGKGEVADYLVNKKGFKHFSARNFITNEIKKRGLEPDRDTMIVVANELRSQNGPTYIFEQLINQALEHGGDSVVESIRAVAEARYTKEHEGIVLGVDADPKLRYDRSIQRGSETDKVTFEEWCNQERLESNPDDPTKQDIFGALKMSDHIVHNEAGINELHHEIDEFLEKFGWEG